MAQTARSLAQIYSLLADNTTGNISPQDVRDAVATLALSYGEIYIEAGNEAATTIGNTTDYFNVAGTFTLGNADGFDMSAGNGLLTYTGAPTVIAVILVQYTAIAASGTQTAIFRVEKTGADIGGGQAESVVLSTSPVPGSIIALSQMSTGDTLNLAVRNTTGAVNIEADDAHLVALGLAV